MRIIRAILRSWLVIAAGLSVVFLVIYASVQQVYRINANDPQIQLVEDAAQRLGAGEPVGTVLPSGEVDISKSLAIYMIVFNPDGTLLASNARLSGQIPVPPPGVLENAFIHGENRITWQPRNGTRSAIVVKPIAGQFSGYVLVGRSLREVEIRESKMVKIIGIGWLMALSGTLFLTVVMELIPFTQNK